MPDRAPRLLRLLRPRLPGSRDAAEIGLLSQGALSTVGVVVQGAVRFIISVTVGNVFGKVVLGSANAAISLSLFASLLQPSAAATSATKFVARARGAGDLQLADAITAHLVRRTAAASVVLGAICGLVALWLLGFTWGDAVFTSLLVVTYSGYMVLRGVMFGSGMVPRATVWDLVTSAISIGALGVVLWRHTSQWVLAPLVIGYAAYVVTNVPRTLRGTVERSVAKEMDAFLWLTLVNSLAAGGFLQMSMVVARYFDAEGAGAYAAAMALATPASLVSRSLSLVLFPSLSAAYGRGDHSSVRRQTDLSTRALVVVSMAVFGPLMILSPVLIHTFFRRAEFREAVQLLPVLLLAVMVLNVVIGATNALLTREQAHARIVMTASLAGAAVGLLAWVATVPRFGVIAVAVGYLVGSLVMAVIPVVAAWRLEQLRWGWLWGRLVGASVIASLLCWWLQAKEVTTPGQVVAAVVFGLAWLGLAWPDVRATASLARRPA